VLINISSLTKDKITEIFCIADDFCKEFDQRRSKIIKYLLSLRKIVIFAMK
jgi:hypothetical protein